MAKKDWNEKQKVAKAVLKFKSGTNTLRVLEMLKVLQNVLENLQEWFVIGLRHSTELTPSRHLFGTTMHKRNEIERSSHWHIDTARLPVGGWKESIGQLYFAYCQKNRKHFAEKLCRLLENCPSSAVSVVWKREKRGGDLGARQTNLFVTAWEPQTASFPIRQPLSRTSSKNAWHRYWSEMESKTFQPETALRPSKPLKWKI